MKKTIISFCLVLFAHTAVAHGADTPADPPTDPPRFELSVLPEYVHNTDEAGGGLVVQFSSKLSNYFWLGMRTGGNFFYDNEGSFGTVPLSLVPQWNIPINKKVSIPIAAPVGFRLAIEGAYNVESILEVHMEAGVNWHIKENAGITLLGTGGIYYYLRYWPQPVVGGKLGAFFRF